MKIREDYTCPLEIAHDIIKGKWKPIILFQLQWGAASLSDLERSIAGILYNERNGGKEGLG